MTGKIKNNGINDAENRGWRGFHRVFKKSPHDATEPDLEGGRGMALSTYGKSVPGKGKDKNEVGPTHQGVDGGKEQQKSPSGSWEARCLGNVRSGIRRHSTSGSEGPHPA